ncbi:MAG: chemotaxis protein CheA [Candidatus Omnitrophota bacterium]|nr:chemotaxis protein CheA [Candidatus Omnitrophota bacterium]
MPFDPNKYDTKVKAAIAEHLQRMNAELLQFEQDPANKQLIDSLMRSAHSIKSISRMFGYPGVSHIAHGLEDGFLGLRHEGKGLLRAQVSICLRCLDTIKALMDKRVELTESAIAEFCLSIKEAFGGKSDATVMPVVANVAAQRPDIDNVIRVDIEGLNRALNISGEQIIIKNRLQELISRCASLALEGAKNSEALETVCVQLEDVSSVLDTLVSAMSAEIMNMRMIPISHLFQHFNRTMRDLALEKGKEIIFETHGAETKVDKAILDELYAPIIHILRNAIDHGIEPVEERLQARKDKQGRISLSAAQEKSRIVIEISDDGRGIDVQRLKQKAVAKGIIRQDTSVEMIDEQALQLIFCPGLSTKDEVSDTSGRGVGLDVVREKVFKLKGIIEVASSLNKGARFTLKLPATVTLRDAIFVSAGGEQFAVLTDAVYDTMRLVPSDLRLVEGREEVKHKGYIIPLVRLSSILGIAGTPPAGEAPVFALVVKSVDTEIALAVDEILEHHEIVVKNLKSFLANAPLISGATISEDGRVVLVLDIPAIVTQAVKN